MGTRLRHRLNYVVGECYRGGTGDRVPGHHQLALRRTIRSIWYYAKVIDHHKSVKPLGSATLNVPTYTISQIFFPNIVEHVKRRHVRLAVLRKLGYVTSANIAAPNVIPYIVRLARISDLQGFALLGQRHIVNPVVVYPESTSIRGDRPNRLDAVRVIAPRPCTEMRNVVISVLSTHVRLNGVRDIGEDRVRSGPLLTAARIFRAVRIVHDHVID